MQRPSVTEITKELLAISKGDGLTYSKANKLPLTQTLPAVDASLRHNRRSTDDRGAVAVDLVECVARSHHLLGEKASTLVCMALNIEPISDLGLDARIDVYMSQQYISERRTFNAHRKSAYERLAGRIVALGSSPCDSNADQEAEEKARIESEYRAAYDKETLTLLEYAWHRICFTNDPDGRKEALCRFIKMIPGVAAHVRDEKTAEPYSLVQAMMRRVLQTEYPRWLTVLNLQSEYLPAESLLNALEVLGQFDGKVSRMVQSRNDEVEIIVSPVTGSDVDAVQSLGDIRSGERLEEIVERPSEQRGFRLTPSRINNVQEELARSYGLALEILLKVEDAGGWSWIPRPDQVRISAESPLVSV